MALHCYPWVKHMKQTRLSRNRMACAIGGFILAAIILLPARQGQPAARAQDELQQGISYATWWAGNFSTPDADLSLARLADTGANWVSIVVTQYQDNVNSTAIAPTDGSPTDADVIHAIAEAHDLGLKVMLKPHVDLWNDPAHWRGEIGQNFNAAQWDDWFASYRTFINHYAGMAEDNGVEQFAVGVELSGTEDQESRWRTTIDGVRDRFSGPITYAANHSGDETSLTWWDAVDLIGVDAYYPLAGDNTPTAAELAAAWQPVVATLADLSADWGKPIIFTEVGYRSIDGAGQHPWDWQIDGTVDLAEQALLYEALLTAVFDEPWFAGAYMWDWNADPYQGGPCDTGYEIYDKPAENVLRGWYGAPPRPPDDLPPADYDTSLDIYTDSLGPGWESWSWDATVNFAAINQVYSGARSTSVAVNQDWGALYLHHNGVATTPYYYLEFYIRKGAAQQISVIAFNSADESVGQRPLSDCRYTDGAPIAAQTWTRVRLPLEHLNAGGMALGGVAIQADRPGTFWIDDMRLLAADNAVYTPIVLNPGHDTHVRESRPTKSYGNQVALSIRDAGSDMLTYLKFDVSGLNGSVHSATLRLYVTNAGPDGGAVYAVDNNYRDTATPWAEAGLTWNNAPAVSGAPLAVAGAATRKQWLEWDVTPAIAGNGVYSFALRNAHRNTVSFSSAEGSRPPELVIEWGP